MLACNFLEVNFVLLFIINRQCDGGHFLINNIFKGTTLNNICLSSLVFPCFFYFATHFLSTFFIITICAISLENFQNSFFKLVVMNVLRSFTCHLQTNPDTLDCQGILFEIMVYIICSLLFWWHINGSHMGRQCTNA